MLLPPCTLKGPPVEPLVARVRCWYIPTVLSCQGIPKSGTDEAMEQVMKSGTLRMTLLLLYDEEPFASCMKRSHKRDLDKI